MKYPIPNDWNGENWCQWAVCWPDSPQWLALLRGFITLPQRGRTWDEKTGNVRNVQLIGRDITAYNLPMEGVIMSCGQAEELASAIRYLADRLYNKPICCDGTGGTGGTGANGGTQGVVTVGGEEIVMIGSEPAGGLPTGETMPAEGFEDQEAYDLYKCQVAHQIIDGAVATLRNLAALSVGNITGIAAVIGLAFAGVIILPVVAIPILVSAMGLLFGVLIVLSDLSDDIQANREDYICALYNSNDTEGALGAVLALVSSALTALGVATSLHPAVKVVVTVIFSTDTLNQLWARLVAYSYPGADCSGCGGTECVPVYLLGETLSGSLTETGTLVAQSTMGTFSHSVYIEWPEACQVSVSLVSGGGDNPGSAGSFYVEQWVDGSPVVAYEGNTPPTGSYSNCRLFQAGAKSSVFEATFALVY